MVSWSNDNDGEHDEVITSLSSSNEQAHGHHVADLERSIQNNHWEKVLQQIDRLSPSSLKSIVIGNQFQEEPVLHAVLRFQSVPMEVVEAILRRSQLSKGHTIRTASAVQNLAPMTNDMDETPLHVALQHQPERVDLVKRLLEAFPEAVHSRDYQSMRPIDHLANKIIMMQEKHKYHKKEENDSNVWESTRAIILASQVGKDVEEPSPYLVHACLRTRGVPYAITALAMKTNKKELQLTDSNGDLPLHIIARVPPPTDSQMEEGDEDFLLRVLHQYPQGAACLNGEGHIPLMVAKESGRAWDSGMLSLLEAYPEGIVELDVGIDVYPHVFERLSLQYDTAYAILRAQPEIFAQRRIR